jgi:hypothetical protein
VNFVVTAGNTPDHMGMPPLIYQIDIAPLICLSSTTRL